MVPFLIISERAARQLPARRQAGRPAVRTSLPATRDRRSFSYPWLRTQLLPCWIGFEHRVGSERALDRCTNSHATSLPWVLFVPSPLPGVRLVATRPTVRHPTSRSSFSSSSTRFLAAVLLRRRERKRRQRRDRRRGDIGGSQRRGRHRGS